MSDQHPLPALNKLCKWRTVLAGWVSGTRAMHDPGSQGMRNLMDKFLVARVESSALISVLIEKGVFTSEEFTAVIEKESASLDAAYEKFFPGFRTFSDGITIYDVQLANETMQRFGFPE